MARNCLQTAHCQDLLFKPKQNDDLLLWLPLTQITQVANCAQEPERIPGSVLPHGICHYNSVQFQFSQMRLILEFHPIRMVKTMTDRQKDGHSDSGLRVIHIIMYRQQSEGLILAWGSYTLSCIDNRRTDRLILAWGSYTLSCIDNRRTDRLILARRVSTLSCIDNTHTDWFWLQGHIHYHV